MTQFLAVALALAHRNTHNWLVTPSLLIPSIGFPLFFLVAFAGGLSVLADSSAFDYPPGYTAFQFVFIVLQASAFIGVFTGIAIAADFESGFGRRLMLAAQNRLGLIAGYALAAVFRTTAIVILLQVVALAAGMRVDGGIVDLAGLYLLALLVSLGAMLFATGIALRTRTVQSGPAMQIPVFLVLFLAPVYVPRQLLSGWDRDGRSGQPVHTDRRGRARSRRRPRRRRGARLRQRARLDCGDRRLGDQGAARRRARRRVR